MLLKSKIAQFAPYSDAWYLSRAGRFTGSLIGKFMLPKGLGDGGHTWIRRKIGEVFLGRCIDENFTTSAMQHGVEYERHALAYFKEKNKIQFLVSQCTILHDERFSVTPDSLIVKSESSDGLGYSVETVEVKCLQPENHIELLECQTPKDLYSIAPLKYWQVISQMEWCGALTGHFFAFHPDFKEPLRSGHIIFKKRDLVDDFRFFNTRIEEARKVFNDKYKTCKLKHQQTH